MITTLTGKNQITVPAEIARQMGLEPGAKPEWAIGEKPHPILIKVQPRRAQRLARIQELGKSFEGRDLVAELIADRRQES